LKAILVGPLFRAVVHSATLVLSAYKLLAID